MGGLVLAWVTGETILVYQAVRKQHRPPVPGKLLGSSAIFAILAVIAEFGPGAAKAATAAAWAFDIAALLQVLPEGVGISKTTGKTTSKTTAAAGKGKAAA